MGKGFSSPIAERVWKLRYRLHDGEREDRSIADTWSRVAKALAAVEPRDQEHWARAFEAALRDFRFLPGGRILAGAGSGRRVTLLNCFVMGVIQDSMEGIFRALQEGAITMQMGGGVGYDFSTLRPEGAFARSTGTIASGPVSFMRVWNAMCDTVLSTGARRGAMMATLRADHPDIETFIQAKRKDRSLDHFNMSVLVPDAFMTAVARDEDWPLIFPLEPGESSSEVIERAWTGSREPVPCRVYRTVKARDLWNLILRSTYDFAEPGVLFIDRINAENNLAYEELISATNPCGEIPLPPYGSCDLGSLNLTRFVEAPFTPEARLAMDDLLATAAVAVRMLDDVLDASAYPLPAQEQVAKSRRRLGLGITGLADALIMLGLRYDGQQARDFAKNLMRAITVKAYETSVELAKEKGVFPALDVERYLASPFVQRLPESLREKIRRHGIRNSHLTAIAPAGTISLLAGNVSSGIEPVFALDFERKMIEDGHATTTYRVTDYAASLWRATRGGEPLPKTFVTARDLPPQAHVAMVTVLQPHVDNSISKTVNIPADLPFDAFREVYDLAYRGGAKGCTTFRPNEATGSILDCDGSHCCNPEREAD